MQEVTITKEEVSITEAEVSTTEFEARGIERLSDPAEDLVAPNELTFNDVIRIVRP